MTVQCENTIAYLFDRCRYRTTVKCYLFRRLRFRVCADLSVDRSSDATLDTSFELMMIVCNRFCHKDNVVYFRICMFFFIWFVGIDELYC